MSRKFKPNGVILTAPVNYLTGILVTLTDFDTGEILYQNTTHNPRSVVLPELPLNTRFELTYSFSTIPSNTQLEIW